MLNKLSKSEQESLDGNKARMMPLAPILDKALGVKKAITITELEDIVKSLRKAGELRREGR